MRRRPTSLDMLLMDAESRLLGMRHPWRDADEGGSLADDPEQLYRLYYVLAALWLFAYFVFAFAWTGIGVALVKTGVISNDHFVVIFVFGSAFCITGAVDGVWRDFVAWEARSRYRAQDRTVDAYTRRLVGIARVPDATILLQLAAGVFFAWRTGL